MRRLMPEKVDADFMLSHSLCSLTPIIGRFAAHHSFNKLGKRTFRQLCKFGCYALGDICLWPLADTSVSECGCGFRGVKRTSRFDCAAAANDTVGAKVEPPAIDVKAKTNKLLKGVELVLQLLTP
jgi:hypothetical protein